MQTKTGRFVVIDRDTAFFFLDTTGIEDADLESGNDMTVEIDGTVAAMGLDWTNEDDTAWLQNTDGTHCTVKARDDVWVATEPVFDFEATGLCPIPTPLVFANKAEWEAYKADNE